ncbi:MAG: chorismate synthase [Candidatus Altiarchaeota archaeon]|nr:chorismate synthase [Candidatus Altiarchaeota archaeon]
MNTIGRYFRVTTWGESHGPAVGAVVDGCPSNLEISADDIQMQLNRRRPGQSSVTTARAEEDMVEVLSGVFDGKTLGTPISMMVRNRDADSSKYREFVKKPRPGHADLTWRAKFGHFDFRGGGRASARETVGRVCGGAVAKKLLEKFGIECIAYTKQVGNIVSNESLDHMMKGVGDLIESNPVRALDIELARQMEEEIHKAKAEGDSVGGVVELVGLNLPACLGEPVFGKISSDLAAAMASIPAVKGVEFGLGFKAASKWGSQVNDTFILSNGKVATETNNCGGMLGGITDGMPLVLRVAFKPTASISKKQKTVDLASMKEANLVIAGRHDPCVVPRAVPVVEAMANIVIADHMIVSGKIPRNLG